MSAPQQLTPAQRDRLRTAHHLLSRREMVRHWLLSQEDRARIEDRRRSYNRLGFAVQLCLLRYPGWPLGPGEDPPPNLLKFVAEQLDVNPTEVAEYSRRPQTRTDHAGVGSAVPLSPVLLPFPALLREHLRAEIVESGFPAVQLPPPNAKTGRATGKAKVGVQNNPIQ